MVVIIGAGIAGLRIAYRLSLRGKKVIVVEKEQEIGGNCSWMNLGKFTVDNFYHIITSNDRRLLNWIEELEIGDRLFPVELKMGFYQNDRLYPIGTPYELLSFPPLSFVERMRLGISILRSRMVRNWRELENISAAEWLSRLGGADNYRKLWQPVMKCKFGPLTDEVCAVDMWFRINRISSARGGRRQEGTYYLRGGFKAFFDALEERLKDRGVEIIKGRKIVKIESANGIIPAVVLDDERKLICERAISTVSLPDFVKLLPQGHELYAERLRKIRYLNNVCLILRLKKQLAPYYQLNLGESDFPFTGIIGADALYPPGDFDNSHIFYISKYFLGDDHVLGMEAEDLLNYFLPHLNRICPEFDKSWVLDITLTKKKNVESIHSLNYSKLIPSNNSPINNLYLLNTAQIYPEPTVLDASVVYADRLVDSLF